jgi:hypothetical protein
MADGAMVTMQIVSPDLDREEIDEETKRLRDELREAGVDVEVVSEGGQIPAGAKSGFPVELASAIAVGLATTALEEVIRYVWAWLKHRKHPENVRMAVSGGSFELSSDMSRDQLKNLLDAISAAQAAASPT